MIEQLASVVVIGLLFVALARQEHVHQQKIRDLKGHDSLLRHVRVCSVDLRAALERGNVREARAWLKILVGPL